MGIPGFHAEKTDGITGHVRTCPEASGAAENAELLLEAT